MHYDKRELILIYNKDKALDRKTLAMAHTFGALINRQELNSVELSETLFLHFLKSLGVKGKEVVDKSNRYYQSELRGKNFTDFEWYNFIKRRPNLLKAPLAMYRDKAVLCVSPNDVMKIDVMRIR